MRAIDCKRCGQLYGPDTDTDAAPPGDPWHCAACHDSMYGGSERHEPIRLFSPAPAIMPGQLGLGLD